MANVEWTYHPRPTIIHAVSGIDAGIKPIEPALVAAVAQPLVATVDALRVLDVDRPEFWRQLMLSSASMDPNQTAIEFALRKTVGPAGERNQSLKASLEEIFAAGHPHIANHNELKTRSQPLQSQWQIYGPGLLKWMMTRTDPGLLVSHARVIMVKPIFGGAGQAHLHTNSSHIEAMMVNGEERLPEVLRLAWMISQLHIDLPKFSEEVNRRRIPLVAGLAMIPPALEAGADLEISPKFSLELVSEAIVAWRLLNDSAKAQQMAGTVTNWWQTASAGSFTWKTAITALDQMVSSAQTSAN